MAELVNNTVPVGTAMRKASIFLFLILLLPMVPLAQETSTSEAKKDTGGENKTSSDYMIITPGARYSDKFEIDKIYFNKTIDLGGRGEVLKVVMVIKNLTDDPQDLYIFTIATCEKPPKELTSFDRPIKQKDKLRNFEPYPDNPENFRYPKRDKWGNIVKDEDGNTVMTYLKNPKDPKEGVNPDTGKPYRLKDKLVIRTRHLSKYRTNYTYFNHLTVIIFNEKLEPVTRQIWRLKGYRR
jgi:hypothetical protein